MAASRYSNCSAPTAAPTPPRALAAPQLTRPSRRCSACSGLVAPSCAASITLSLLRESLTPYDVLGSNIKSLKGDPEADYNGDSYVTGSELGQFLQEKITALSGGAQTPQYGKMADPRLNRRGVCVYSVPFSTVTRYRSPAFRVVTDRDRNKEQSDGVSLYLA